MKIIRHHHSDMATHRQTNRIVCPFTPKRPTLQYLLGLNCDTNHKFLRPRPRKPLTNNFLRLFLQRQLHLLESGTHQKTIKGRHFRRPRNSARQCLGRLEASRYNFGGTNDHVADGYASSRFENAVDFTKYLRFIGA